MGATALLFALVSLSACAFPRKPETFAIRDEAADDSVGRQLRAVAAEQARQSVALKALRTAVAESAQRPAKDDGAGSAAAKGRAGHIEAAVAALEARADENARRLVEIKQTLDRLEAALGRAPATGPGTTRTAGTGGGPADDMAGRAPPTKGGGSVKPPDARDPAGYQSCQRSCAMEGAQSTAAVCSQRCTCQMQCLAFGTPDSCQEFCRRGAIAAKP